MAKKKKKKAKRKASRKAPTQEMLLVGSKTKGALNKTTSPAALRHVAGFPNLGLLRRLRHSFVSSVKPGPAEVGLAV